VIGLAAGSIEQLGRDMNHLVYTIFPALTEALSVQKKAQESVTEEVKEQVKEAEKQIKVYSKFSSLVDVSSQSMDGWGRSLAKASSESKAWTAVSRLISGSPLWKVQNKIRAVADGFAVFYKVQDKNKKGLIEQAENLSKLASAQEEYDEITKKLKGINVEGMSKKQLQEAVAGMDLAESLVLLQGKDGVAKALEMYKEEKDKIDESVKGFQSKFKDGEKMGKLLMGYLKKGLEIFAKVIFWGTLLGLAVFTLRQLYKSGGAFKETVDAIFSAVKWLGSNLFSVVVSLGKTLYWAAATLFSMVDLVIGLFQGNSDRAERAAERIYSGLVNIVGYSLGAVLQLLGTIVGGLMSLLVKVFLPMLAENVGSFVSTLIKELPENIIKGMDNLLTQQTKGLGRVIKSVLLSFAVVGLATALAPIFGPFVAASVAIGIAIDRLLKIITGKGLIGTVSGFFSNRAATGANFITSGPTPLLVGDNPGGKELVQVTPLSSPNINGPRGGNNITVNVQGRVGASDRELDEIAKKIGNKVLKNISRSTSTPVRF
tara:strand:+ start:28579 stop:30207 length:1629 start_codon:yes stop_codon:yes gene_type:complete